MIELREAVIDGDRLVVTYAVTNEEDVPIYLFDLLWVSDADGFALMPEGTYRHFDGDRLVLQRAVQPMPPGMKAEEPEAPYATRLKPGQTGVRRMEVPVPVVRYSAYTGHGRAAETAVPVGEVMLSLGYVRRTDILEGWALLTKEPEMGEGIYSTDAGLALEVQRVMTAGFAAPDGLTGYPEG